MLAVSASWELKDIATVAVSLAALITSITVAAVNFRQEMARRASDAKKAFSDAINGLSEVRIEIQNLRRELGDQYSSPSNLASRVAMADHMSHFISKATDISSRFAMVGAPFEHLLLAAGLMSRGRIAEAIPHYNLARGSRMTPYSIAEAERVYGRALYAGGQPDLGRRFMLGAATSFEALSATKDYEASAMLNEAADTYRRLFEVEIRFGQKNEANLALSELKRIATGIRDIELRKGMELYIESRENDTGKETLPKSPD